MEQILGWIATILFSVMLIPQILKTIRERNTSGVSIMLFVTYLVANIIAFIYAIMISQNPLIIKYVIGIGTAILYIFVYGYYTFGVR